MFVGDAGEGSNQDNHHQTDQAHFREVKRQAGNQNQRRQTLHNQRGALACGAFGVVFGRVVAQHAAYVVRQQCAIAEPAKLLQQDARHQACHQHRQGNRCDLGKELREVPAHFMADQQVLGFAHQSTHAAQRGTYGAMHQQAAQERPELFKVALMQRG
ncbi:hypothetical protein D3C84_802960 [compost metagenome]